MNTDSDRRFAFGRNWQAFRREALNHERIEEAEHGLERLFGMGALEGRSFLDVGSGSGLMSLAAHRLGAARIVSFDFDPDSVACTTALRDEYARDTRNPYGPSNGAAHEYRATRASNGYHANGHGAERPGELATPAWTVLQGSVLDEALVRGLGTFDVVYAWGVLHHTGDLWRGLTNTLAALAPGGVLGLAVYNRVVGELGTLSSESWQAVKTAYVEGGAARRELMLGAYVAWRVAVAVSELRSPLREVREYYKSRGMSWLHDARDWLGGHPYEYASVAEVTRHVADRGFRVKRVFPTAPNGWGNNEFVLERA